MIIGYEIWPTDNDDFFTPIDKLPKEFEYSNTYDYNIIPTIKLKRRKLDIGGTYDGFTIVSQKFKVDCEREQFVGIRFIELPADKNFFLFRVDNILEFDSVLKKQKRSFPCGEDCLNASGTLVQQRREFKKTKPAE